MSRQLLLACCLLCGAGSVAAQTTFPIDVQSGYLHVDPADTVRNALAIDLSALGLLPDYTITIESVGDWHPGPGGDTQQGMLGVFSSDATLLGRSLPHRVPGAIGAGIDKFTGGTWPNSQPTDIPEDFDFFGSPGITLVIPPGAARLFVGVADIYYRDNSDPDGDFGVKITLVSTTSVPSDGPNTVRHLFPAGPNPFSSVTSFGLRLETPATVQLTVHDITGRLVHTLVSGALPGGHHLVNWDGRDFSGRRLPAGSYFARLEGASLAEGTRVVLIH